MSRIDHCAKVDVASMVREGKKYGGGPVMGNRNSVPTKKKEPRFNAAPSEGSDSTGRLMTFAHY
jgi:hypothetical protein